MDVPEMDGVVYIENKSNNKDLINQFLKCQITEVRDYDLIGILI